MSRTTTHPVTNGGFLSILLVLAALPFGCGLRGLRFASTEHQKQARDLAHRLAQRVQDDGTPPGSLAGNSLVHTTREALAESGPPEEPVDLDSLIAAGEADAWRTREKQVAALRTKFGLLLRGLTDQVERIGGMLNGAVEPRELTALQTEAQRAMQTAAAIAVPDDPTVTEAERQAAQQAGAAIRAVADEAAQAAQRRPAALDVGEAIADEADFWYEQFAPLLLALGVPSVGAVGLAIKRSREALQARRDYDAARRSGAQIVLQNEAFMNSPLGAAPVQIGDQQITAAEALKTFLGGQDAETREFVTAAKGGGAIGE